MTKLMRRAAFLVACKPNDSSLLCFRNSGATNNARRNLSYGRPTKRIANEA
jgi:hypothetical protein